MLVFSFRPVCFIMLLFSLLSVALAAEQISVAVVDFEARGVEKHEAAIIAERFRGHLVKSGFFKIMERSQMETILKEQGFQQSGMCSDASCIVEMGQMLAVEKMIVGSVGKIGSMYTLNVKLLDVKTSEIILSYDQDLKGSIEDVMLVAVPSMGDKLIREAQSMKVKVGYLNVTSTPSGATISIDNKSLGTTPIKKIEVPAGQQKIVATLADYVSQDRTVSVSRGGTESISFDLSPTTEFVAQKNLSLQSKRKTTMSAVRYSSAALAAIGLGVAGFYHMQWASKDKAYHAANDPDEASSLHSQITGVQRNRSIGVIAGALGAVGLGVTFVF